jgi:hypothetical protein
MQAYTFFGITFGNTFTKQLKIIVNRIFRKFTLAAGILVGIILVSQTSVFAEKIEKKDSNLNISVLEDLYEMVVEEEPQKPKPTGVSCQIFNNENELVYSSNDKDDPQLQLLLRKSDLIMKTNSSSYYLLGD